MKKTFLILNDDQMHFIKKNDIAEVRQVAINICDHSKEIIIREVDFSSIVKAVNAGQAFGKSEDWIINEMQK